MLVLLHMISCHFLMGCTAETLKFVDVIIDLRDKMSPFETRKTYCPKCKIETEHQLYFECKCSDIRYVSAIASQCLTCGKKVSLRGQ